MSTNSGSSGGSSSSSSGGSSSAPTPRKQSEAPRGAYLGDQGNGQKLVSLGDGTAVSLNPGSGEKELNNYVQITPTQGQPSSAPSGTAQTLNPGTGGSEARPGSGAVDTTVTQKPAAGADGPEGTTVTNGPRSDFSVVLAGQVGKRPDRNPARSNNFVSLVGGSGGLGRRTSEAKRSLIGGA